MNFFDGDTFILLGNIIAFSITILVFLYAFGDSPPFRLAIHIFIGVAAGYVGGVAWHSVIIPQLIGPSIYPGDFPVSAGDLSLRWLLVVLLLTKLFPRIAVIGNPASAYLVAVGAATAVGGAIQGTLFPLASSSSGIVPAETIQLLRGGNISPTLLTIARFTFTGIVLLGTIATLMYFHFGAKSIPNQTPIRNRVITIVAWIGQVFIAITFGVLFAGVFIASLDALIERLFFLWSTISSLIF